MPEFGLSPQEYRRYSRHLSLDEIGLSGQKKLKTAKVLCVGAGGLGSASLQYLAAAGVGEIGIIDDDIVDESNLQRQILYTQTDIGSNKAVLAKQQLLALNPHITVQSYAKRLTESNVMQVLAEYDCIMDGSDNFATHYLVNDTCYYLKKPLVLASISQFSGQCSVFHIDSGPCLRCLFPNPPGNGEIANCAEAGVIGALPGIMGCIQAMEVIKWICNIGKTLAGRLLVVDALTMQFSEYEVSKSPNCELCVQEKRFRDLLRPLDECYIGGKMKSISVQQLSKMKESNANFLLLDVREPHEYMLANIGGHLIPLGELPHSLENLDKAIPVVVHCRTGPRAEKAAQLLMENGFDDVAVMDGGLIAWKEEIDHSLKVS